MIEIAPKSAETRLNWADARLYCFSLNIDGKTGWRLPTKEELNDIYVSENVFVESTYWSSTEFDANGAWYQNFYSGGQVNYGKPGNGCVRAIRSVI